MCLSNAQIRNWKVYGMKKKNQKNFYIGLCLLAMFAVWTVLVLFIDVQKIGPAGSSVGFASLNGFIHNITGVHMSLYTVTDWLGLVPIITALGFAILGLIQWIERKNLLKVDHSILILGLFYIVVIAVYFLFEAVVINYRPVLIDGNLEASYPSSTTMLVMCVMSTAAMQLKSRIKNCLFRKIILWTIYVFTAFTVICRLLSGVHWFTDILGGMILSSGLVEIYRFYFDY